MTTKGYNDAVETTFATEQAVASECISGAPMTNQHLFRQFRHGEIDAETLVRRLADLRRSEGVEATPPANASSSPDVGGGSHRNSPQGATPQISHLSTMVPRPRLGLSHADSDALELSIRLAKDALRRINL
jgi:hypothetical protein